MRSPFPKAVFLQLNNLCNAKCKMCPYDKIYRKDRSFKFREMSANTYLKILEDLSPQYTGQIGFYLHFEPLMDDRLVGFMKLAKKHCPQCRTVISTNCSLLKKKKQELIECEALDEVCLNMNGGTKEVYEKQQPPFKFEEIIENIKDFVKDFKGHVYINFVKTNENKDTVEDLKKIFPNLHINAKYWATNRVGEAKINKPNEAETRFKTCQELDVNMPILLDGTVLLCCNCWKREVVIGNVKDENLLQLWHSPRKHHYYNICKICN